MVEQKLTFCDRTYIGLRFELGNVPLLIVKAKKGYIACSYIDKQAAEHLGDVAAFISNVKTFEQVFHAKVKKMTAWAEDLGVREGMSVKKALEIMDKEDE